MTMIGPYRLLRNLGTSEAGEVWSAFAEDGTTVTIAMIDPARAGDPAWLNAVMGGVDGLVRAGELTVVGADLSPPQPWVACAWDEGIGAARIYTAGGASYQPATPGAAPVPPEPIGMRFGPSASRPPSDVTINHGMAVSSPAVAAESLQPLAPAVPPVAPEPAPTGLPEPRDWTPPTVERVDPAMPMPEPTSPHRAFTEELPTRETPVLGPTAQRLREAPPPPPYREAVPSQPYRETPPPPPQAPPPPPQAPPAPRVADVPPHQAGGGVYSGAMPAPIVPMPAEAASPRPVPDAVTMEVPIVTRAPAGPKAKGAKVRQSKSSKQPTPPKPPKPPKGRGAAVQPTPAGSRPPKRRRRGRTIFITVLVVLLLAAGGAYAAWYFKLIPADAYGLLKVYSSSR